MILAFLSGWRAGVGSKLRTAVRCAAFMLILAHATVYGAGLPILWAQQLGNIIESCAAIDTNGNVYITCSGTTNYQDFSGGKLVALSPQGKIKWEFKTFCDIKSSPAIGNDGTIYFGARDRKFYAVSGAGKGKWTFATEGWIDSSPAIATNGNLYFGGWDGKFYALNASGSKIWEFSTGGPIDSSPAIEADGTIYFGSHDSKFYALNPDGSRNGFLRPTGRLFLHQRLIVMGRFILRRLTGNLYVLTGERERKNGN